VQLPRKNVGVDRQIIPWLGAVGLLLLAVVVYRPTLWGPTDRLKDHNWISSTSYVTQSDIEYCLLKNWGGGLALQPSKSPNSSTIRLHDPISGFGVDVVERGDHRKIIAYAPKHIPLFKQRAAAATGCH
jgi:hypothetical protein